MVDATCSIADCDRPVKSQTHGWCNAHYRRWLRHGDPLGGRISPHPGDEYERFWVKVDKDGPVPEHWPELGPCWTWTGSVNPDGRGTYSFSRRWVAAHRFAYEHMVGLIPEGLTLDHLCVNPLCVNPVHLEPVTHAENNHRTRADYCKRGHNIAENEYITPSSGYRHCGACARIREKGRIRR